MGDRDYFRKDFIKDKSPFKPGFDNAIVSLIILNLIVFTTLLGLYFIYLVIFDTADVARPAFEQQILSSLTIPAASSEFIYKPWTLFSYMFTHSHFDFLRLFSNMIWLWSFGYLFQNIAGHSRVIPLYLYSGVAGGIVFVLSYLIFPGSASLVMTGAATAIIGFAVGATAMSPDYRLFPQLGNGIPLWILTAIFLILDLATVGSSMNLLMAHIAAGLMGYVFVYLLKKGTDIGEWMNRSGNWARDLFNPEKKYRSEKDTLYYKAKTKPFEKKPNLTQQKLDDILDKINQKGYDTLTEEEKEFLKKASEQL